MWREALWHQFAAAIDMFERSVRACPDPLWREPLWEDRSGLEPGWYSEFWYLAFHTIFFLDAYLQETDEGWAPPAPFTLEEPDRVHTRDELLGYLAYARERCRTTLADLTDEGAGRPCHFSWGTLNGAPLAELLLDNLRHVQEHGAQLRMLLGQKAADDPRWVGTTRE